MQIQKIETVSKLFQKKRGLSKSHLGKGKERKRLRQTVNRMFENSKVWGEFVHVG